MEFSKENIYKVTFCDDHIIIWFDIHFYISDFFINFRDKIECSEYMNYLKKKYDLVYCDSSLDRTHYIVKN